MAQALTVKAVEAMTASAARREVPDGLLPGLYFVVQPSGVRSWAVRYRMHGRPAKYTLGTFPAVSLGKARELARGVLEGVAAGVDPAAVRRAQKTAKEQGAGTDFKSVATRFIERYAKEHTREATWREYQRLLEVHAVPKWGPRPIDTITTGDIIAVLDEVVDSGAKVMANRLLAVLRRLFNWTVERHMLASSPCQKLRAPSAEVSRDRILTDSEIRLLWHACDAQGWPFGSLAKLLLLLGQRRDEVAEAAWAEFDLKAKLWTIPAERAKNGVAHEVPLSLAAIEILNSLPRIGSGEGKRSAKYVLSTTGKTPISGFSKAKIQIDREISALCEKEGIDPPANWTFHDLRRTMASGMARLGFSVTVVEKILNHVSGTLGGVTGVYQRHGFAEEKRAALEAWAAHVEGVVTGVVPASNVVPLRSSAGA